MKKMFSKFPITMLDIFYTKPNLPKKKILSKHSREPEVLNNAPRKSFLSESNWIKFCFVFCKLDGTPRDALISQCIFDWLVTFSKVTVTEHIKKDNHCRKEDNNSCFYLHASIRVKIITLWLLGTVRLLDGQHEEGGRKRTQLEHRQLWLEGGENLKEAWTMGNRAEKNQVLLRWGVDHLGRQHALFRERRLGSCKLLISQEIAMEATKWSMSAVEFKLLSSVRLDFPDEGEGESTISFPQEGH